jgi:hypothetical protein
MVVCPYVASLHLYEDWEWQLVQSELTSVVEWAVPAIPVVAELKSAAWQILQSA